MLTVIFMNFERLVKIGNQCLKFDDSSGVPQCAYFEELGPLLSRLVSILLI